MSKLAMWRNRFATTGRATMRGLPKVAQLLGAAAQDSAALAGAGLVAYGAGLIYRPAGFIVLGGLLIVGAFLSAKPKGKG